MDGQQETSGLSEDEGRVYPPHSVVGLLYRNFREHPVQPLGIDLDHNLTYGKAYCDATALAWYLECHCDLTAKDTVVYSAPNLLLFPVILAAVQLVGARIALLPHTLPQSGLEQSISLLKPKVLILSTPEQCARALYDMPDLFVLAAGCPTAPVPLVEDVIARTGYDESRDFPNVSADSQVVVFSSGSTGAPKAIVNRVSSFVLNGEALTRAFSLSPNDVIYLPVPFIHVFGVVGTCATLVSGATLVTSTKYLPDVACSLISSTHATVHFGVSTMFVREQRLNADGQWDFSTLRAGLVAGAGCPEHIITDFDRDYGCKLMQSYGMSETAATLTVTPLDLPADVRARTVGVPIEGSEVKLLPQTGELCCKSASMMLGVLQPDGSLKLDLDEGGWFHSGDVAEQAADGSLRIIGRIKDMIIRGGVNIFPAEIEKIYEDALDIESCCVVGYPDFELGERTALCVIMKEGATRTARDLRNFAKGRIEKLKVPDVVLKLGEFPLLGNGKIDKGALKDIVCERLHVSQ